MDVLTKTPEEVFASVDSGGSPRAPDLGEAATLIREVITAVDEKADAGTVPDIAPIEEAVNALTPAVADQGSRLTTAEGSIETLQTDVAALENGFNDKASVRLVATSNVTLSGEQTIDGVLTSTSDVAVVGQSTASQNGVYTTAAGAWTRRADLNDGTEMLFASFMVREGTDNANSRWKCITPGPITLGSTNLTFAQIQGSDTPTTEEVQEARDGESTLLESINLKSGAAALSKLDADEGVTLDFRSDTFASRSLSSAALSLVANSLAGKVSTVRSTTKFVTTKAGLLASVAIDTNAFDYLGQGARPVGMTVFPASESRLRYSNVFNAGSGLWVHSRITPTINYAAGPDGVTNATRLVPTSVSGNHITSATASAIAAVGAPRCFSVFVKRDASSSAHVRLSSGYATGLAFAVNFDLVTGTASLVTGVTGGWYDYGIQRLNSGWFRIWIAHTSDFDFMQPNIWILDSAKNIIHTVEEGILACKARADAGRAPIYPVEHNHATNYVTTGADKPVFTLTGTAAAISNVGTISVIAHPSEDGADYERVLFQIDDGDDNDCIRVTNGAKGDGSLRAQVISGGVALVTTDVSPATSAADRFRAVVAWKESGLTFSLNGVEIDDILATIPATNYTTLRVGHTANGDDQWWPKPGGGIETITITPRYLTHEESWGAAAGAGAADAYVLVFSGQSNMYGARTGGDLTTNQNVFAWNPDTLAWQVADLASKPFGQGYGAPAGSNNLAFHMAKRIQEKTGKRVYIVLLAYAGQPIRKWVVSDHRPFWDELDADATAALAAIGRDFADAFCWHQGEGDSNVMRTTGTLGPLLTDVQSEHPSEHLYREAFLDLVDMVQASAWGDTENMKILAGELVQGGLNGAVPTDDRNDVISSIARYGRNMMTVPSAGLSVDGTLHHFDGAGLEAFGHRYADVFLGEHPGNNHNPADDRPFRRREQMTTNTDAEPVNVGQRNCLLWARSASARSMTIDPLDYAVGAIVTCANLGDSATNTGNFTVKPGTSRVFDATGNPTSLVLTPGDKVVLECIEDEAPGTAQAWQVLP